MDRWEDKVAVVTGASAGIGAAVSEELVKLGVKVVGIARRKEKLEELKKKLENEKGEFHYTEGDIGKEEDIANAFQWIQETIGPVSILINNAGIARVSSLITGNSDHIKDVLNTNVFGLCIATREAIKHMKTGNIDGHIIHVNSVVGHKVVRRSDMNVYPASKYAVTALTETLRNELSLIGSKIKVSSISPGMVNTDIFDTTIQSSKLSDADLRSKMMKTILESTPMLQPEDVSDAIVYMLSTPPHVQVHELIIRPLGENL